MPRILIIGARGSGKSTRAYEYAKSQASTVIFDDVHFEKDAPGNTHLECLVHILRLNKVDVVVTTQYEMALPKNVRDMFDAEIYLQ